MKKIIITFLLFLCAMMSFAQDDGISISPTFGVELDREVDYAIIEGELYENVVVEIKAADLRDMFERGVRVIVKDAKTGKRIYKKRFSKSYLYAYHNAMGFMVGKGNAITQVFIGRKDNGEWLMIIREKGVYF